MVEVSQAMERRRSRAGWWSGKRRLGGRLLLGGALMCPSAAAVAQSEPTVSDPVPDPTPPSTILAGQVLIGPVCPVVRPGDQCADQPYQGNLSIRTPGGDQEVAQVMADAEGSFGADLDPSTDHESPSS